MKTFENKELIIEKVVESYDDEIDVVMLPKNIVELFCEKVIKPFEKSFNDVFEIEKENSLFNDFVYSQEIKFSLYSESNDFLYEKYISRSYLNTLFSDMFEITVQTRYTNLTNSSDCSFYISLGYSEIGIEQLENDVRVKSIVQAGIDKEDEEYNLHIEYVERKKLEEKKLLEEKKIKAEKRKLKNQTTPPISKEKLFHISILENNYGNYYCSEYIVNERIMDLINKYDNDFETVGDGIDITGRYGFINYIIKKDNIKVLSKNKTQIKRSFKSELSELSYTETGSLTDEKLIIIPLADGRDYFDDTICWVLENHLGY